jgi:hypothetical protein
MQCGDMLVEKLPNARILSIHHYRKTIMDQMGFRKVGNLWNP